MRAHEAASLSYFNGTNGTSIFKTWADLHTRQCHHTRNQRHSNGTRNGTPTGTAMTARPATTARERQQAQIDARVETASRHPCTRCGADTVTARTPDRVAAVDVRADPTPLDPVAEILARLDGRHTWCLVEREHAAARIRWRGAAHIRGGRCTHTVIADHRCPPQPVQETLL